MLTPELFSELREVKLSNAFNACSHLRISGSGGVYNKKAAFLCGTGELFHTGHCLICCPVSEAPRRLLGAPVTTHGPARIAL